jgi:hypothetical protein
MTEDVKIHIRPEFDPDSAATLSCDLSKGATYHPWNGQRTDERKLQFVTFSKIEHYVVDKSHVWDAFRESEKAETKVAFKPGDRWEYLAYGAEGHFYARFNGEIYWGFQDLVDVSTSVEKIPDFDSRADEWLHLTCDNGAVGWLLMKDVEVLPAFGAPNTLGYGSAADKTD